MAVYGNLKRINTGGINRDKKHWRGNIKNRLCFNIQIAEEDNIGSPGNLMLNPQWEEDEGKDKIQWGTGGLQGIGRRQRLEEDGYYDRPNNR